MTSMSKNAFISKLDDIVNDYNNTYYSTIKMKPFYVTLSTYTEFGKENNEKDAKFKVGDNVRISEYKNIFAKDCPPNYTEDVFEKKNCKRSKKVKQSSKLGK